MIKTNLLNNQPGASGSGKPQRRTSSKASAHKMAVVLIAGFILFVVVALIGGIRYLAKHSSKKGKTPAVVTSTPTPASNPRQATAPALPRECTTPCALPVQWDDTIWTGGRPVLIKANGKKKWFLFRNRKGDVIPLNKFNPGEMQFASPDSTPFQVQILPAG